MNLKLTVVDQSPVHGENRAIKAPHDSIELAKACDQLGYYRYWVAEHHNSIQFANPCPEILVSAIASVTSNMRIGSGGVMLTHYSAYKVAEVFRMLETLFPERIDLGVGRAPGGNAIASAALAGPHGPTPGDHFPQQAAELVAYLRNSMPEDHPFSSLRQLPDNGPIPEIWMLGSGGGSSTLAGQFGIGLSVARFIAPEHCKPAIFDNFEAHREQGGFQGTGPKMLAIAGLCADTTEEARYFAGPAVYRKVTTLHGIKEPIQTPSAVQDFYKRLPESVKAEYDKTLSSMTCGTPDRCSSELIELAEEFGVDEIAIVTVSHGLEERIRSYELFAQALQLNNT